MTFAIHKDPTTEKLTPVGGRKRYCGFFSVRIYKPLIWLEAQKVISLSGYLLRRKQIVAEINDVLRSDFCMLNSPVTMPFAAMSA